MPRNRLVNPVLGVVAAAAQTDDALLYPGFVPIIPVGAIGITGTLLVRDSRVNFGRGDLKIERARLAPRSQGETLPYTSQTYALKQSAHEIPLDTFYDGKAVDQTGALMEDTIESAGAVVKVKLEEKLAAKVVGAGSPFTSSTLALLSNIYASAVGVSWDLPASDPAADINAIVDGIWLATGVRPDAIEIPWTTLTRLGRNASLKGYHALAAPVGQGEGHLRQRDVARVITERTGLTVIAPEVLSNTAAINKPISLSEVWDGIFIGRLAQRGGNRIVPTEGGPGMTIDRVSLVGLQVEGFEAGQWTSDDGLRVVPFAQADIDWHVVDSDTGFILTTVFF